MLSEIEIKDSISIAIGPEGDFTEEEIRGLKEVELPLLEIVMKQCDDNQSKASKILGINRGTLRTKLKEHNLL